MLRSNECFIGDSDGLNGFKRVLLFWPTNVSHCSFLVGLDFQLSVLQCDVNRLEGGVASETQHSVLWECTCSRNTGTARSAVCKNSMVERQTGKHGENEDFSKEAPPRLNYIIREDLHFFLI